jgi:hypothetical protein
MSRAWPLANRRRCSDEPSRPRHLRHGRRRSSRHASTRRSPLLPVPTGETFCQQAPPAFEAHGSGDHEEALAISPLSPSGRFGRRVSCHQPDPRVRPRRPDPAPVGGSLRLPSVLHVGTSRTARSIVLAMSCTSRVPSPSRGRWLSSWSALHRRRLTRRTLRASTPDEPRTGRSNRAGGGCAAPLQIGLSAAGASRRQFRRAQVSGCSHISSLRSRWPAVRAISPAVRDRSFEGGPPVGGGE